MQVIIDELYRTGPSAARRVAELAAGYKPQPYIPDEFIGTNGRPRAHWRRFLTALTEHSADDIGRRFATADRHIRDTGVSYRAYGDTSERAWPLSRVPLLIEAGEWREIAHGIEQRARLLELVLADIYGDGRLIAAGDLPAAAVTGSREYLHFLHGVRPQGGKFLHIYAADIGRGPDGPQRGYPPPGLSPPRTGASPPCRSPRQCLERNHSRHRRRAARPPRKDIGPFMQKFVVAANP